MPIPYWPTILPHGVLQDGYSRQQRFQAAVSEFDDGPAGARRWSRIKARREPMTWFMSPQQLEAFNRFYEDDLKDGTIRFLMATPNTDQTTTSMRRCHFEGQRPTETPDGSGNWIVAGQLTVYL